MAYGECRESERRSDRSTHPSKRPTGPPCANDFAVPKNTVAGSDIRDLLSPNEESALTPSTDNTTNTRRVDQCQNSLQARFARNGRETHLIMAMCLFFSCLFNVRSGIGPEDSSIEEST